MSKFTLEQEKQYVRIKLMRDLINETELHGYPCPLLEAQLRGLEVFTEELIKATNKLADSIKPTK